MAENESENSFRSILKNTSIFGGVQVFLVLINILRGKFVALLLGPTGMGISSLFTTTANVVTQMSSLGLNLAIVKEVSHTQNDSNRFAALMALVRRLLLLTALLGALFTVVCARWLSELTFGSADYSWQFVLLGAFVFLTNMGGGYSAALQGLHEVKRLSRASLIGGLTGLLIGVPLYWLFGTRGIVPALVVYALVMYIFYRVNLAKARKTERVAFRWADHRDTVKKLLLLGMVLMAGDLITRGCNYLIVIFIRTVDDVSTVGLFQAGSSITTQYVGTVLAALSLDYFPRLTKVMHNTADMNAVVNRQAYVVSLIMAPLVCVLILSTPILIPLLLSEEFVQIIPFVRLLGLVMLFRTFQFPLGYIAFAGDRKRLFFWMEGISANALTLVCSLVGFRLGGLNGLAVGMIADNILCLGLYMVVNGRAFGYRMNGTVARSYLLSAALCVAVWASAMLPSAAMQWTAMSLLTAAACLYSLAVLRVLFRKE